MIAAALNLFGSLDEQGLTNLVPVLVKLFDEFKVVQLNPYDEAKKNQLQLCQPEKYEELVQHIEKNWDPSETFLELRGPKAKLQRVVRQMFFFDAEKKFEKVLLAGCDGMRDFPWAIQIVLLQLPVMDEEQNLEWISRADLLIINALPDAATRDFIDKVKLIRPDIPIFTEKLSAGWSQEIKACLEDLFASYLEKRQKIKVMLAEKYPEQSISCEQAGRMAGQLSVNRFLFGNVCDEYGYSITHCGFGCF